MAGISWYHRMALPHGITTPGLANPAQDVRRLKLPTSLAGKTVLDVGAWDGYYSFEAARRGASRVMATDSFVWEGRSWGTKQGFLLARQALGLEAVVDDQLIDVMDLSPQAVGDTFDVVLFLGVLYHLRDPITALERVASVCHDLLVVETETAFPWRRFPAGRLFPGDELNDDGTNWWALNPVAVRKLLWQFGFSSIDVVYRTTLADRAATALKMARGGVDQLRHAYQS
ncbi:MAG: class I SAM-dependent methyltransferase, partial [Acidimicrobiales bacterium]